MLTVRVKTATYYIKPQSLMKGYYKLRSPLSTERKQCVHVCRHTCTCTILILCVQTYTHNTSTTNKNAWFPSNVRLGPIDQTLQYLYWPRPSIRNKTTQRSGISEESSRTEITLSVGDMFGIKRVQHSYLQNFEDLVSFSSLASSQNLLQFCKRDASLLIGTKH